MVKMMKVIHENKVMGYSFLFLAPNWGSTHEKPYPNSCPNAAGLC